jgi:ATP-dependent DNA ligase
MQYTSFKYIFPPRAENKINPKTVSNYDTGNFIAQVKYNGSSTVLFLDGEGGTKIFNRHNEPVSKDKFPKCPIDFKGIYSGHGYMVVAGELMNKAQAGEDGNKLMGFIIWDILVYRGHYLVGKTFQQRLELLEQLFPAVSMRINHAGVLEQYEHLNITNVEGVYRAKSYTKYFETLYEVISEVPAYEGLVLKKAKAKLDFGFTDGNNANWQLKIRKATKNYRH